MKKQAVSNGKTWLKTEMKPYRARIFLLSVLSVVTTLLSLTFAYMVRYLINSASNKQTKLLLIFSGVVLGVLLVRIALQTIAGYTAEKYRAKITSDLRIRTFSKLLRSDYGHIQSYHSGELLNRLTTDINEIAVDTVGLMPAVVGMIVQCLGSIVALVTIDPLFTAIYVVCGTIFGGITAFFRKQIKKRQKEVLEADGKSRAFMQESIASIMTVKAYGAEDKSTQKAGTLAGVYYDKRMRRNVLRSSMSAVFSLLSNFGLIFAVVWCSFSVLGGNTDYGSILSVILLLMQLQQPFSAFSSVIPVFYSRNVSAERLQEIEVLPRETLVHKDVELVEAYRDMKEITLQNVSFTYGRDTVLQGADIALKKGEIICLTGPSGAGKSTIFKLLLHMFTQTEGEIALHGEHDLPLSPQTRGLFAYVPQGKFLFSGTIYENLTFFTDGSDTDLSEKVKNAIEIACAQFVWDLPQGLQTPLGENGVGLSEGQMQRLAVARAILSDRPILLLDEATSALDGETECRLLENIRALKDKTCLIVTHRPAALAIADRVLVVENGKIIENN